ncbi:MAG TPA: 3'-5' exonuclease [Anaerolineales bacterium]|nr:3'-5' exonuclease [Anaerolineales bacterium]
MDIAAFFKETFVSIDVETSGPNPSQYSLLTIGACTITERPSTFYIELKPVTMNAVPDALAVSRLSMERLVERGREPAEAMAQFEAWLKAGTPEGRKPVFVAFNAPFDWMFVNDYFHRFLGRNPFGHAALDIKSFYMGLAGVPWAETSLSAIASLYLGNRQLTHHALRDAMDQAELFRILAAEALARARKGA